MWLDDGAWAGSFLSAAAPDGFQSTPDLSGTRTRLRGGTASRTRCVVCIGVRPCAQDATRLTRREAGVCARVCIRTHAHTFAHTCTHTCTCTRAHVCMHTAHVCLCRQHRAGGCGEHADADLALSGRRRRRAGQGAGGRPRALKVHHALALLFSRLALAPLAAAGRAGSGQAAASIHSALEARSPSCPRTLARASTVKTGQQRRGVPRAFSDNGVALDEWMGGAGLRP